MANGYIALDTVNYVTEPAMVADRVISDYIATNKSQTFLFSLFSIHATVQENAGNMQLTAGAIQQDLENLLGRYLDNVSVSVQAQPILDTAGLPTPKHEILIDATYSTPKGTESLATTIQQVNDSFSRIASYVRI